jgi:hypothetical protein
LNLIREGVQALTAARYGENGVSSVGERERELSAEPR